MILLLFSQLWEQWKSDRRPGMGFSCWELTPSKPQCPIVGLQVHWNVMDVDANPSFSKTDENLEMRLRSRHSDNIEMVRGDVAGQDGRQL